MAKYRQGRLSEEIKKSVSAFLINGAKDPALTSRIISITGVDVTRDLSYATVYVSPVCLSDEDKEMVYSLKVFDKFSSEYYSYEIIISPREKYHQTYASSSIAKEKERLAKELENIR